MQWLNNSLFSPLKKKPFRLLFTAQIFSDLGNWLDFTALMLLITYHWNLGPAAIAALLIALGLPWVVIGPLAAVWVDRLPRRTVMMVCNLLRIFIALALIWSPNLYVLLALAFIKETLGAVFDPARQGMIRTIVPDDELAGAVTLSQFSVNMTKIAGPALGGMLVAAFGVRSPFVVEAFGFFISLLCLANISSSFEKSIDIDLEKKESQRFHLAFKDGWRHISSNWNLKSAIILVGIAMFLIFLYDGLLVFVAKLFGFDEAGFGLLISLVGLGSVLGSLLVGHFKSMQKKPLYFIASAGILSGMLVALMGISALGVFHGPVVMWMAVAFFIGAIGASGTVPFGYILQSETPADLMGRVSATANSIQSFSMLVAPATGAWLAELLGVGSVFLAAGALMVALGLLYNVRLYFRERSLRECQHSNLSH